jgi:hypothetical protein
MRIQRSRIVKVNSILGVEAEHGLVFGYAIVTKVRSAAGQYEDYFDLNIDTDGVHKGQRVSENITDVAVLEGYVDVRKSGSPLPGNEQHAGPDSGVYYDLFPLTEDIAKALDIEAKRLGLLCVYKPEPAVLAKFKDGTYTGFSIEGARVEFEELADA